MRRKCEFPTRESRISPWLFSFSWERRKLGEVCSSLEYGMNAAAKEYDGENKYIRITDIDDNTRLFLASDLTSPDADLNNALRYRLETGDIVFARTGASVGKSYIYKNSDGTVYYAGFLIRAKVKQEHFADFVFQNTLSHNYEKYILITSQRSGQPGVNAQEYAGYTFYIPEYEEQKRIGTFLTKLDTLITLHQRKQNVYVTKSIFAVDIKTFAWERRKLGDFVESLPFKKYIAAPTPDGKIEIIQQGNVPIIGYANGIPCDDYENITIFGDHTVSIYKPHNPFFLATDGTKLLSARSLDGDFFYFLLERYKPIPEGYKRHYTILIERYGYFPSKREQKQIAILLKHIDTLITLHQRK